MAVAQLVVILHPTPKLRILIPSDSKILPIIELSYGIEKTKLQERGQNDQFKGLDYAANTIERLILALTRRKG